MKIEITDDSEDPLGKRHIIPRGPKARLVGGGLPEVISPHLLKLIYQTGGVSGPIGKQFVAQSRKEQRFAKKGITDPLSEEEHEVAPGLVYKYKGRVLWTVTKFCASYCRFCTRGREIGLNKNKLLSEAEINQVWAFLGAHSEINEVIVSGGDPLTCPQDYLTKIVLGLAKLQQKGQIEIVRLGTRLPVHQPSAVKEWHYRLLAQLKNPYLMVHLNHPAELTPETIEILNNFRKIAMATVMSQTVLLKGVNDKPEILYKLFYKMSKEGIRPYYVYQNDPVYWAQHFTVPIKKAIELWGCLRPQLSGITATARFVIDTPFGFGKIPIPEGNAWKVDYSEYTDFKKKRHQL